MFGRAVADRAVVKTDDYANDAAFPHSPDADKVVEDVGIRSMVVAPMVSGDEVFGALGTFSIRTDAFDPAQIALVRSLADHAAAAMANARLIADLDGRAASSPGAPRSSAACARSRHGSAAPRTSIRSSSGPSTRRAG